MRRFLFVSRAGLIGDIAWQVLKEGHEPEVMVDLFALPVALEEMPEDFREARAKALEMLRAVQIRDPERVMDSYPHEVSGGMGQRIMIAMMLAPDPQILIADEPTSALDVSVRAEVLNIMDALVRDRGMGLIFISHDLNLVAQFCDRVLIMYAGRVVETLPARDLHRAQHPYTRGLLDSLPRLDAPVSRLSVLQRQDSWRDPVVKGP